MGRAGVNYKQVSAAAQMLAAEGHSPTVDGVRHVLGGTGSKSTLAPLLKRWKAENVEATAVSAVGLPLPLAAAVKRLHEEMQVEFNDKFRAGEAGWQERIAELTDHATSLESTIATLEAGQLKLEHELSDATALLSSTQNDLSIERGRRHELEMTIASLELRLTERSSENANLLELLAHSRNQFTHFQEAAQARMQEQQMLAERQGAKHDQEMRQLRTQLHNEQISSSLVQGRLQEVSSDNVSLKQAIETLRDHCAQQRSEADQLQASLSRSLEEVAALKRDYDALSENLARVTLELAVCTRELSLQSDQVKVAIDRSRELHDEKELLIRQLAEVEIELRSLRKPASTDAEK